MRTEALHGLSAGATLIRALLSARGRRGESSPDRTLQAEDVRVDRERRGPAAHRLRRLRHPAPDLPVGARPPCGRLDDPLGLPAGLPGIVHASSKATTHHAMDAGDAIKPRSLPWPGWHIPEDLGRCSAKVSGDDNPIHLHPLTARPSA